MRESKITNEELQRHIVRTMLYFDIFDYPLKTSEVYQFLGTNSVTENEIDRGLKQLVDGKFVYRVNNLFSLQPGEKNIARRIMGNAEALNFLTIAKRQATFISKFPFVRGVLASGSLAKGYMDKHSDLDFFIVTAPGRLWIARTLLVMYKRIFLLNSHKYFCVNYFVDENHLEIEDKNLFTATELATVIPLYGTALYTQLLTRNEWIRKYFPNYMRRSTANVPETSVRGFKKIIEAIFNGLFVVQLEAYLREITRKRWKRLYEKEYSKDDFEIAFKSKDHASKNHPQHFQRKIMTAYAEKLKNFKFPDLDEL